MEENYARVNRGLSYEGEGQNRNIPSNLNTVAARDFFFDPTGATTPYSSNTASLKGGTANVLAGDGDHAATDGPTGYQQGYIFNAVLNAGGTIRNYGWMANTPGSIGTIATPIKDPFAAGVVQTTAANQLISQTGSTIRTSARMIRPIRICGASTNGTASSSSSLPRVTCRR